MSLPFLLFHSLALSPFNTRNYPVLLSKLHYSELLFTKYTYCEQIQVFVFYKVVCRMSVLRRCYVNIFSFFFINTSNCLLIFVWSGVCKCSWKMIGRNCPSRTLPFSFLEMLPLQAFLKTWLISCDVLYLKSCLII